MFSITAFERAMRWASLHCCAIRARTWAKEQTSPYVLKEAAILFESGSYKDCDYIITVTAPEEVRIARVMARDHCTEAQVRTRMAQQWSDAQRIALSNAVIENIDLENAKKK